ncbi:MAG: hypothetical protein AMJ55_01520 [Gammaproteobacteria bacterium SG8_15]|nr:MAG: hypothetical protein AMJ55_01520 [Gammaproteobacteria bacterium SG8_15]
MYYSTTQDLDKLPTATDRSEPGLFGYRFFGADYINGRNAQLQIPYLISEVPALRFSCNRKTSLIIQSLFL